MGNPLRDLDWSLVQTFLAVAEGGSLSAAARALGLSQPTLGRQVRALEDTLRADLFLRHARGLSLTDTGAALLEPARAMREAMHRIALTAAGREARLEGTVRLTASVMTALFHLPPIVARIRREEPDIAIEILPSDISQNLLYREADIALRMYRPRQLDLVTRHLGEMRLGMYAARAYVDRRGRPAGPQDFPDHDFIGYDQDPAIVDGMNAAGFPVTRDFFRTRCDDNAVYFNLLRAGCGLGFSQRVVARDFPDLVEIPVGVDLPTLPVWLTAHQAMRDTPRIRRVWDMLAEGLAPLVS
ncbi:MAG: LysR family transcriptional regulator [Rhodobacteraceae bacterium HLUCCA08]|nr:MAG: LysR family transcriptional regulator [Rhodobacteraceae bacterium HLUCCA08]